jgi:DNA-binding PadR family transcriptional regulator
MDRAKVWISPRRDGSVIGMADSNLNATAAALLGLLHEGPMTGGQLMAAAERRLGPFWSTTRSQVYRELPALAEAGYVRLGKPGPRASQPYSISASGKRAFAKWLSEPPGRDQLRNPLVLRVAFGKLHSAGQLAELYKQAGEHHTQALAEARDAAKQATADGDEFGAAALNFSVSYHRAALSWLKTVTK